MSSYEWMELQTLTAEIAASRARLVQARSTRDVGRVRALEEEISAAEARRDRLLAHITTNLVATPEPATARGRGRGANAQNAAPEPTAPSTEALASTADNAISAAAAEPGSAPASGDQPDAAGATAEAPAEQPEELVEQPVKLADQPAEVAEQPVEAADRRTIETEGATADASAPGEDATARAKREPDPQTIAVEAAEPEAALVAAAPNEDAKSKPPEPNGRVVASDAAAPAPAPKTSGAQGGINVWDQLKPGDIERAKQEIETRREEMLARHAEELRGLEADRAQLDTLEQAISTFMQKFSGATGDVVKLDAEREARQQSSG